MQKLQPLLFEFAGQYGDAGSIAAWPIETSDKTNIDGIGSGREDDGNGLGRCHRRAGGEVAAADEHGCNLAADEIGRH